MKARSVRRVLVAVATVVALPLLASCNPVMRCTRATDCPAGASCTAGFCAEVNAPLSPDDAGRPDAGPRDVIDLDPDGGAPFPDAGRADAGLDDGR